MDKGADVAKAVALPANRHNDKEEAEQQATGPRREARRAQGSPRRRHAQAIVASSRPRATATGGGDEEDIYNDENLDLQKAQGAEEVDL